MPGGRPRIYKTEEDRIRARNERRRNRRQGHPSASSAEAPFHNIFVTHENVGGSQAPDSNADIFTDLANTLNNLSVEEHPSEEEAPQLSTLDFVAVDEDEEENEINGRRSSVDSDGEDLAMGDDSPPPSGLPSPQPMDLVIDDATQLLAERLAEQLLGHHGCLEHVTHPPSNANTTSLSELIGTDLPDVLSHPKIRPHPADWENRLPVVARRQLFTGIRQRRAGSPPPLTTSDGSSPMESPPPAMEDLPPPRIDLESDTVPARQLPLAITFDVDSAGGFATSLSVARQGLDWLVIRPPVSNLASSLHLPPVPVGFYDPNGERWRSARAPIHHVPHLPLGRLHGFEAVEVYLLFPGCSIRPCSTGSSQMSSGPHGQMKWSCPRSMTLSHRS
ncbi:hypothetical protein MAP00_007610 [Monascus purpureus]|nr:hypothetical protein MAP00_007610 [Monascus purpureus]